MKRLLFYALPKVQLAFIFIFLFVLNISQAQKQENTPNSGVNTGNATTAAGDYMHTVVHPGGKGALIRSTNSFSAVDIDAFSGEALIRFANQGELKWVLRNNFFDDFNIYEYNKGSRLTIAENTGNVGISNDSPTAKLHVNGFTKLGLSAPAIKMAKYTGTTASSQNTGITVIHELTASKILNVSIVVDLGTAGNVTENYTQQAGYQVGLSFENTYIYVWNSPANSANILNKPFKVLVTYEE